MTEDSSKRLAVVITTIQEPTAAVRALSERLLSLGASLVVAGDKKGPTSFRLEGTRFVSLQDQLDGPFELARKLPVGHYTRKNVAYLEAIAGGARCIYETDDDNAPMPAWMLRSERVLALAVEDRGWVNAYRCFTGERIWPRGFPLESIARSFLSVPTLTMYQTEVCAPIQQGLANGSPDVDAIWRLTMDRTFTFDRRPSVALPRGAWCPFNSQSTWWWSVAYPLMYLPSYCSFRMTDIWRSFIAQRCLWEMDFGVVFHAAEVVQARNVHELIHDFEDEIPGYLRNREIARILDALTLESGVSSAGSNLRLCYEALIARDVFPERELDLVDAWLVDLDLAALPSEV